MEEKSYEIEAILRARAHIYEHQPTEENLAALFELTDSLFEECKTNECPDVWRIAPYLQICERGLDEIAYIDEDSDIMFEMYTFIAERYSWIGYFSEAAEAYAKSAFFADENNAGEVYYHILDARRHVLGKIDREVLGEVEMKLGIEEARRLEKMIDERIAMGVKSDPVEYTDAFIDIRQELEQTLRDELEQSAEGKGSAFVYDCHKYWKAKKRILRDKYGIEWKSPAELNPGMKFQ